MKRIIYVLVTFTMLCFTVLFLPKLYPAYAQNGKQHTHLTLCTALAENATGTIIKGENTNVTVPSGYLPKLMTVLLAAEAVEEGTLAPDSVITVGSEAENVRGAVVWLTAGEKITLRELFKAVIIGNANDAAKVLAVNIGGSEENFVDMMNARGFELGMRSTVFKSCCGGDNNGEHTTAEDMAKLAAALVKHRELKEFFTTWTDRVRNGETEVVNENRLVRTYDGVTGLKACHTEQSGASLILTAERNGSSFTAVVLGCSDEDERFTIGKELLSAGFSAYKVTSPDFGDEFLRPVAVHGGVENSVMIGSGKLSELVVPKSGGELSVSVLIPQYVEAPVAKGQTVGRVGFYDGDTLLYETDLIALSTVEEMGFYEAMRKCLSILYK